MIDEVKTGFYSFEVHNNNYNPHAGSILVTSDTTITLVLDYIPGINSTESNRISMYPKPAALLY